MYSFTRVLQDKLDHQNLEIKILRRRLSQKKTADLRGECEECEQKDKIIGMYSTPVLRRHKNLNQGAGPKLRELVN